MLPRTKESEDKWRGGAQAGGAGRAVAKYHLPADPKARYPHPYELSPLNAPAIIAPSLHAQQPIPAGVNAEPLPSLTSFSVEHRLAAEEAEIEAFEDDAARRLKTSRE
jgi:hypothetical protein